MPDATLLASAAHAAAQTAQAAAQAFHGAAGAGAYIDPGTGSMLFTLAIGIVSASYFFVRKLAIRAKFALSGGHAKGDAERHAFVIFSDDKRYWNVFKPICDEFERRGIDACFWTASPDDPALSESYEHVSCEFIGEGNKAFARLNTMSADVVLATTPGLQVYQWKRSADVGQYVHVLHAADTALGYRMFGLDFYDVVLLTGRFQGYEIREVERLRGIPRKKLGVAGCSYLDAMARRLYRMRAEEGQARDAHRKTVLLGPSWGESGILGVYGDRIIEALLATDWQVIVRPHPQTVKTEKALLDGLMERFPESERLSWNFDNDNFDVLAETDVLITDFSGIVYDYALVFDRPVIYAEGQFDPDRYDACWVDHPLRKFEQFRMMGIPLVEEQLPHMQEVLDTVLEDQTLAAGRRAVRDEVWQHRGQCAQRVVDYLLLARQEVVASAGEQAPPRA